MAGFAFDAFIKLDGFGDGSFGGAGGKELVKLDSPSYNQALQYLGKI